MRRLFYIKYILYITYIFITKWFVSEITFSLTMKKRHKFLWYACTSIGFLFQTKKSQAWLLNELPPEPRHQNHARTLQTTHNNSCKHFHLTVITNTPLRSLTTANQNNKKKIIPNQGKKVKQELLGQSASLCFTDLPATQRRKPAKTNRFSPETTCFSQH